MSMAQDCRGKNNPMYGKKHSDDTIEKMKFKAKGRYTKEWFILRYGQSEGLLQYYEKKKNISNTAQNFWNSLRETPKKYKEYVEKRNIFMRKTKMENGKNNK